MENIKNLIVMIGEGNLNPNQLVTILELCANRLDIDTISEMARREMKSPNGIKVSNQYRKLRIGKQLFAIKGLTNTNLPF